MKAVCITGYKNSGKTELASQVCSHLKRRGYSVNYLKFSTHGFDKYDTDTQRLSIVADKTAGIGPRDSFVSWPGNKSIPELLPLLNADFLIIEGGKELNYIPRIVIPASIQEYHELSSGFALAAWCSFDTSDFFATRDITSLVDIIEDSGFILPGLDCGACKREQCADLAREIIAGDADISECVSLHTELNIEIDNYRIPLNPFVSSLIYGALKGMLTNLKGYTPGNAKIELEI